MEAQNVKTQKAEEKNCPKCGNHCPREALKCGRGKKYFKKQEGEHKHEDGHGHREEGKHGEGHHAHKGKEKHRHGFRHMQDDGSITYMLHKLRHMLHHSSEAVTEERLTASLTEEEKKQLRSLLEKMEAGLTKNE